MSMTVCRHCDNEHTCHNGRRQIHPELRAEIQRLLTQAETSFESATGEAAKTLLAGRIDAYDQTLRVLEY